MKVTKKVRAVNKLCILKVSAAGAIPPLCVFQFFLREVRPKNSRAFRSFSRRLSKHIFIQFAL